MHGCMQDIRHCLWHPRPSDVLGPCMPSCKNIGSRSSSWMRLFVKLLYLQMCHQAVEIVDLQCLLQFLIRLLILFEPLHGQLLHSSSLPTLDVALEKIMAKETYLKELSASFSLTAFVLAITSCQFTPPPKSSLVPTLPSSPPSLSSTKDKRTIQCSYCHVLGHAIQDCWKKQANNSLLSQYGVPIATLTLDSMSVMRIGKSFF